MSDDEGRARNAARDVANSFSHDYIEGLLPIGAAHTWDTCAQYAVPPLGPWDEQDENTRLRFTAAFAGGIEAMAEAAG